MIALAGIGHLVIDDNDGDVPAALVVTDEHFAATLASGVALDRQDRAPDPVRAGLTGSQGVASLSRRRLIRSIFTQRSGAAPITSSAISARFAIAASWRCLTPVSTGSEADFPGTTRPDAPMTASGQRPRIDDRELGRGVVNGTHDDEDYVLP